MLGAAERDLLGWAVRAVVGNAGVPVNAPVETYSLNAWRHLFEVSLFGHIAVTQALLPALICSRVRVVNISSVGGKVAMAIYGPYADTKFALEMVSDALRRVIASSSVRVVAIEPDGVRTGMLGRASAAAREAAEAMIPDQRHRDGKLIQAVAAQTGAAAKWSVTADAVAGVIGEAVTARDPRLCYTVGRDAAPIPSWPASCRTSCSTAFSLPL